MRLQYSSVTEEFLDSALELQTFRKEVRGRLSLAFANQGKCIGLKPELFSSRLDELERRFENRMMAFLSVAGVLQAEKDGKLLTARRPVL
jgi:hypothetical protein